ncbi:MAG TPA: DUF4157 domain-containing protein [Pyrinomonadaceae bacterium]|nr:DUF4157 domain-containing protein [Pyrinomonadaceae bacterium]
MSAPAAIKSSEQKTQSQSIGFTSEAGLRTEVPDPYAGILGMQRKIGNRMVSQIIQTKLTVGSPGDCYEQEADRVADQILQTPQPIQVRSPLGQFNVQRKCAGCASGTGRCQDCDEEEVVRLKPITPTPAHPTGPEITDMNLAELDQLRSGGQPLSKKEREFFEPRLGHDLSNVRIHNDSGAADSASSVSALAYTTGNHIVFGRGSYAPSTTSGKRLLAHELTHVIQQGNRGSRGAGTLLQRQPAPEVNRAQQQGITSQKWSPELEAQYRRQGQEGAANAIRRCRTMGGSACNVILTVEETSTLYVAYKTLKALAEEQQKEKSGSGGTEAAPLVAGGLGLQPSGPSAPKIPPSLLRPPVTPPVTPTLPPPAGAGAGTAVAEATAGEAAAGAAVTVAELIPPAVIIAGLIAEIYLLVDMTEFQQRFIKLGYVFLDAPLSICIRGCHTSSASTSPRSPQLPKIDKPGPQPITDEDRERFKDWLPKGKTGPTVGPTAGPRPQTSEEEEQKKRRGRYPIYWPATLLPPPLSGSKLVETFVRVSGAGRDPDLAETLLGAKWARARQEDLRGGSLVPHHVIPLFLGGADLPSNVILWNAALHRRGHPCLRFQPQMMFPRPGLPPLSPDLYAHFDGTPYYLAGVKDCPSPEEEKAKPGKK